MIVKWQDWQEERNWVHCFYMHIIQKMRRLEINLIKVTRVWEAL